MAYQSIAKYGIVNRRAIKRALIAPFLIPLPAGEIDLATAVKSRICRGSRRDERDITSPEEKAANNSRSSHNKSNCQQAYP